MAGIILCIFVVVIIAIVAVIVKLGVEVLKDKDIDWYKNFTWWRPRSYKDSCNIEGVLDRLHDRELQFQQEEAAREKKAASGPSVFKFVNTRITLQDVHDYVKRYPPLGQAQCTGCHIACKDDCNRTCSGNCSTACNSSCHFACVGVCGGGCSGEASALGVDMF